MPRHKQGIHEDSTPDFWMLPVGELQSNRNMKPNLRWLSILTLTNAVVVGLMIGFLLLMFMALAAFASGVPSWPVALFLAVGFPLSVSALRSTKRTALRSRFMRAATFVINGTVLAI